MNEIDSIYLQIDKLEDKKLFQDLSEAEITELHALRAKVGKLESEEKGVAETIRYEKSLEMKRRRGRGRYGEQRLAKKVGGVVCGRSKAVKLPSGKYIQINCQRPPDVVTEMFSFESKWLKNPPKVIDKIMTQATTNAPQNLIPVGVVGDREQRTVFYIMSEKDWLDLHG
ncbi:hypothetical protein LCGC14_2878060 [marine sediment metagenome]|uniref:Uncharacterized protein n=1 Tax=marine sediment metagenome TaxID=412755 RepID=A0A0F8Y166_9ZZZZ